jgi:hypothetical protein
MTGRRMFLSHYFIASLWIYFFNFSTLLCQWHQIDKHREGKSILLVAARFYGAQRTQASPDAKSV